MVPQCSHKNSHKKTTRIREGAADFGSARGQRALLPEAQTPKVRCATMRPGVPVGRSLINQEEYMFNRKGRFGLATLACVGLAFAISTPAAAWERGSVENFTAPSGSPMMEGITVGRDGNVYVSTFDPTGSTGEPAQVLTFSP